MFLDRPSNKKIFDLFSLTNVFLLYSSQMSKYDLYTDITFISNTLNCEEFNAYDIGMASLLVTLLNILLSLSAFYVSAKNFRNIRKKKQE